MLQMTLNRTLFLLLVTTTALARSQSSCSAADEQVLKQKRIQAIKISILSQLGMKEPPPKPAEPLIIDPEILQDFRAVSQMTSLMEREREKSCRITEHYSQPIISFAAKIRSAADKRSALTSEEFITQDPPTLLSRYNLSFDFNLNEDLSFVTQASLVLFQVPASKVDPSVRDVEQYVEVKSTASTPGFASSIIAGKHLSIFEAGYQVLDMTPTVKMWASSGVSGEIDLSVSIYCLSSPNCAQPDGTGQKPRSIEFVQDQSDIDRAPRLIVTAKNPLEVDGSRTKRNTASPNGSSFCVANQSTCCLKELVINFKEDLPGMDFIVDPPVFQANYCEGVCPTVAGGDVMTPLLFDFISKLQDHPASSIMPCCSGSSYESLNTLINIGGGNSTHPNLKRHKLENVIVTGCKCG